MYRLRKILAIIIPIALILTFFSCEKREEGGFLRSLDAPATMKVEGERHGVAFSADIEICEGEGKLVFTSPDSMAGISVTSAGGVCNCTLDVILLTGISAEKLAAPLLPFLEIGEALSAEKITDENGVMQTLITTQRQGARFEYYIDSKSGFPIRVLEKDAAGETVMRFDIKDYVAK